MRMVTLPEILRTGDGYPSADDAPRNLWHLEGNCGPIVAWSVLKYFGIRVPSARIIRICRYAKKDGVFPICMAVGLAELGLDVRFHTDDDPRIQLRERTCLARAIALGIHVGQAVSLRSILSLFPQAVPVVFYNERGDQGHFSPLLGRLGTRLVLPFANTASISERAFFRLWSAEGICRQCLIVRRKVP